MFPFVPVDSQTGDIGDWGTPFHGLFTLVHQDPWAQFNSVIPGDGNDRSFLMTNNGVRIGYPDYSGLGPHQAPFDPVNHGHRKFPNTQNSRKIVVPGHTYTRDPEREDGDKLTGVEFQPFAIVNNIFIGGFPNSSGGWVYVAGDGSRWSVASSVAITEPDWASWTFTFTPFGISRIPNSFYGVSNVPNAQTGVQSSFTIRTEGVTGMTDIQQSGGGGPTLLDIDSGGRALIGLGGGQNSGLYENFDPVGLGSVPNQRKSVVKASQKFNAPGPSIIWEVVFNGTPGVDVGVAVNVVRTQEQCAGVIVKNEWDDDPITQHWGGYYQTDCGIVPPFFFRPNTGLSCPPGLGRVAPIEHFNVALLNASVNGPIAQTCGWTRVLDDGTSIIDQNFNDFLDFKWWTFTDAGALEVWPNWGPASKEYVVGENVAYNNIVFNCTVAHTSDPLKQPGVGVLWNLNWELPYEDVNFDIADVPVWAEASSYNKFDLVREGAADYWLAKGQFTSFDSGADPEETNHDQPNAGDNFAAFWDGPFNVLLNPVWIAGKAVLEGWIIESTYTEPAIATDPIITLARWECIRGHVTVDGPQGNKPGVGVFWPQFWEKAFSESASAVWEPPNIYKLNDKVNLFFDGENRQWEANAEHSATATNFPPNAVWTENTTAINCREAVGQLEGALNQLSYHVKDMTTRTESIDFHVTNIAAGAFYTDADAIKLVEVDVHYKRDVSDTLFDSSWVWTDDLHISMATATGHIERGPSWSDELFEYKFRVGGAVKQTITHTANARAEGTDDWTEDFANYPLTWSPTGSRSLVVIIDGEVIRNFNDSFTVGDTEFGGATEGEMFDANVSKSNWGGNAFCNAFMFEHVNNPFLENFKTRLEDRVLENPDFPGAGVISFLGGDVSLGQMTGSQYTIPHPVRTQAQIDAFDPFPTLITLFYGRKLAGPFSFGFKTNGGALLDSQYLKVLAPGDLPWVQYGLYAPDAEDGTKITLTHSSPIEQFTATWLRNADYGDDIACAYDPINKVIHRNSQYRVVYI